MKSTYQSKARKKQAERNRERDGERQIEGKMRKLKFLSTADLLTEGAIATGCEPRVLKFTNL